jgi:hypothetical protein
MPRNAVTLLALAGMIAAAGTAAAEPRPRLGVMVDAGVPDGGNASLVYRPVSRVRLAAGVSHNLVGPGVRGSVTLAPLTTWITPTLSATYGRFFERDASKVARIVTGDDILESPAHERFGYDYADAHLGLELGRERVTFFLHGGVTRVRGQVHDLDENNNDGEATVTFSEDPRVTMTTVSARLGFIFYIL